jgi:hypothetical protein
MKILKLGLRFWISIASMMSFLVGWVMLAHAPKPSQNSQTAGNVVTQLPTLEPLPSLSNDNRSNIQNQPFFNDQQSFFNSQPRNTFRSRPFFSTGGS